jgi:Holliday junction DNA helicase RuvA
MITFLEGVIVEKEPARVVLNVGGVGYEVFIPLSSFGRLPDENAGCRLLIYENIREDAHDLFGFMTDDERRFFLLLLGVSGIGPKTALSALNGMSVRELKLAIVTGDVKRISTISGIGKKTAERIIVELKDKLGKGESMEALTALPESSPEDLKLRDAILALISLGYKQEDARKRVLAAVEKAGRDAGVEELVRLGLAG